MTVMPRHQPREASARSQSLLAAVVQILRAAGERYLGTVPIAAAQFLRGVGRCCDRRIGRTGATLVTA
jgi:hypothetical protein